MGYLILVAVPLVPLIAGVVHWWINRTWKSFFICLVSGLPMVLFGRLAYIVFFTESADPSTAEIALPFVLGGFAIVLLVALAFDKWPKQSKGVTDAAAMAGLSLAAARGYQHMRDREQAEALADELERREKGRT